MRRNRHIYPFPARNENVRPLARLCPLRCYPAPCRALLIMVSSAPVPRQTTGARPLVKSLVSNAAALDFITTCCFSLTKHVFAQSWSVVVIGPLTSARPCVARVSRFLSANGKNLYARVRAYICACVCAREKAFFASIFVFLLTTLKNHKKSFSSMWLDGRKLADQTMTSADQKAVRCHV